MKRKLLRANLEKSIMDYIVKFGIKHKVFFDFAVNDDIVDGPYCFNDIFFSLSDIVYDIDIKLPGSMIFEWHETCEEYNLNKHPNDMIWINLFSWHMGLRYD